MDYTNITLYAMMQARMSYHSQRQDILAGNIANIDTPGFRPDDLKKLDFNRLARAYANQLKLRATSPLHQRGGKVNLGDFRVQEQKKTYETTPVKNAVVMEEQMMKVAENNIDFQTTTNLYRKTTEMFKLAVSNR